MQIVIPFGRHTKQTHADLREKPIHERVAGSALWPFMGGIIKFNGGDDSRGLGTIENEVDVLLADAISMTSLPIAIVARDDIGKPNLARNLITIEDEFFQHKEKSSLILREQEVSGPKNAR